MFTFDVSGIVVSSADSPLDHVTQIANALGCCGVAGKKKSNIASLRDSECLPHLLVPLDYFLFLSLVLQPQSYADFLGSLAKSPSQTT
jgi:hypothetical protein